MQSQAWLTGEGGESGWVDVSWNHAVNIGAPVNPWAAVATEPAETEMVEIPPTVPAIGPTPTADPGPITDPVYLDTEFGSSNPFIDYGVTVLDNLIPGQQDTWHDFVPGVEEGEFGGVVVDVIPGAQEGIIPDIPVADIAMKLMPLMLVMNMFNNGRR